MSYPARLPDRRLDFEANVAAARLGAGCAGWGESEVAA